MKLLSIANQEDIAVAGCNVLTAKMDFGDGYEAHLLKLRKTCFA